MTRLLSLIFVSALLIGAEDQFTSRVDEILKDWNKPETPGAAVAVIRNGKIEVQKGYGIANLEYGIPITPDTVFHVASVSKQFTAMALVLLEQDRKLSIDDDIRKYLTEMPDYGKPISIRNLLQHTSGVRDQWQTLALAGWRLDDVITQKQILRMMFRQKELNFDPGARHLYSNGGYTLAAEIVARVSGKSFPDFCQQRIFKPLSMSRTHFHIDHKQIVKDRAYSYSKTAAGYEAAPLNYANAGATSLFTTAPDLARWLDNFRDPKVGGTAGVARLQEQGVLANGEKINYALGVTIGKHRGLKTLSHAGGDAGYRSFVLWFPDHKVGVAVASNAGNFDVGGVANKIAAVFLGEQMEPEQKKAAPAVRQYISLDPSTLDKYTGTYRMAAGFTVEIDKRDGKLHGGPIGQPKSELKALGPARFYLEQIGAEVEFVPTEGEGMTLKILQPGGPSEGKRIKAAAALPADLLQYQGRYWSEELEARYSFAVRDGKLLADNAHHGEIAVIPSGKDQFLGGEWFLPEVNFVRGQSGNITGVRMGGGRVKGILFSRQ